MSNPEDMTVEPNPKKPKFAKEYYKVVVLFVSKHGRVSAAKDARHTSVLIFNR